MFANGDDAKNFITSETDFKAAFNRFGVCAANCDVEVVAFSVEDSHPHALLFGTYTECMKFKTMYERSSLHYIAAIRGDNDGVALHLELCPVEDDDYLKNVATYVIVQATKDGKAIMPYDYLYGTGALYFRSGRYVLPWMIDKDGYVHRSVPFGILDRRVKSRICCSRMTIPDDWEICNGFILPLNYLNPAHFESFYKTHNTFRAFLSSGKKKDQPILDRMAEMRGVIIEDLEARKMCEIQSYSMFRKKTSRHLSIPQRLELARELRRIHHLSYRQLSTLCRLPEGEVRKYVK